MRLLIKHRGCLEGILGLARELDKRAVDHSNRLILFIGLDVHYDLRVLDIKHLIAPSIQYRQGKITNGIVEGLNSVNESALRSEANLGRLYPTHKLLVSEHINVALLKIIGERVL